MSKIILIIIGLLVLSGCEDNKYDLIFSECMDLAASRSVPSGYDLLDTTQECLDVAFMLANRKQPS